MNFREQNAKLRAEIVKTAYSRMIVEDPIQYRHRLIVYLVRLILVRIASDPRFKRS